MEGILLGRYYGGRRYYRRGSGGNPIGGGLALLFILFIANLKTIVSFVLAINAFVIIYYTARYRISSRYKLENLDIYKRRFIYSGLVALASLAFGVLFKPKYITELATVNIIFALASYMLVSAVILIINCLKPKVKTTINGEKIEQSKSIETEEYDTAYVSSYQKHYSSTVDDNNSNSDNSTSDFEFDIPEKTDAELKGEYGELIIAGTLTKLPSHYKVINGVLLEYKPNTYSQIDHLVISRYGIFVIEAKNYSGYIFGKAHDSDWSQVLYGRNNEKKVFHMPNPIKQNIAHIKALQTVLTGFPAFYHNVVVFTGNCKIERTEGSTPIVHVMKLLETIRDLSQVQYLRDEQVNEIYSIIRGLNKPEMLDEHVERLSRYKMS
jgi:hypothetical protein